MLYVGGGGISDVGKPGFAYASFCFSIFVVEDSLKRMHFLILKMTPIYEKYFFYVIN